MHPRFLCALCASAVNSPVRSTLRALRSLALLAALSLLGAAQIDPNRYLEHIKYLASPN